ncbi:hypothetical protein [Pimelobacter simplex]|uniref:hypothetical protein n=1 Tax=Nocardioides simplex TaxID=2045 RepID=UPI00214FBBDF|nr:hypothetical protein [Pimelobacter simplex]UUW90657.1 hypothetical protein M0M43_03970 [Pimelobacter simplex]UUW94486.1 hypothetical protein M0M48_22475 [Pimelobacter simplex]
MSSLGDVLPAVPPAARPSRRRRRTALLAAGAVGAVAVVGGGAWAWREWFAQGPQAAEALPADTVAYVAVDLDPPGGQKVAAYDTLRRFPSLKKHLGLASQDDLRRSLVEQVIDDNGCGLGFDDFDGWAGDRAALAVVPQDELEPVVVVQAGDADEARTGLAKALAGCEDEVGFATGDGWVVLARTETVARQVLADGRKARLAEDRTFRDLTGAAGDPGVVTLYASPEAGQAVLAEIAEDPFFALFAFGSLGQVDPISSLLAFASFLSFDLEEADDHAFETEDDFEDDYEESYLDDLVPEELRKQLAAFAGLGGVARFEDGTLELEVVADPALPSSAVRYDGRDALAAVRELPAGVALAFGGGFADGWAEKAVQENSGVTSAKAFEKATGLGPADLAALGGDRVAFVAAADFVARLDSGGPREAPLAARVTGDPETIEAALAKLRTGIGPEVAPFLASRRVDGGVLIGPSAAFLDELARPQANLGDDERFQRVLPDAAEATTLTYVDFDAGDWLVDFAEGDLRATDIAPLDSAGLLVADDGDRQRLVLRVAFDE